MENIDLRDITKDLGNILKTKINETIIAISVDYNLDENELLLKYSPKLQSIQDTTKIKRKRKVVPKDQCCLGRKQFGEQCTRRKKSGSEFCGSHMKSLPYGRIDDKKDHLCKVKGKRGRKKKKNNLEDDSEYIQTWIDKELGDAYLIDKHNTVYSNNPESPKIIGKKNIETGKIETINLDMVEDEKFDF